MGWENNTQHKGIEVILRNSIREVQLLTEWRPLKVQKSTVDLPIQQGKESEKNNNMLTLGIESKVKLKKKQNKKQAFEVSTKAS